MVPCVPVGRTFVHLPEFSVPSNAQELLQLVHGSERNTRKTGGSTDQESWHSHLTNGQVGSFSCWQCEMMA